MKIILDSNLLLLFVVGATDRALIGRHKRLSAYADEEYFVLTNILNRTQTVVVTPNVLTETSNLAGQIGEPARSAIYRTLRAIVGSAGCLEIYVESTSAAKRPEFERLGLTDAALLHLGSEQSVLLTSDLHLYLAALAMGRDAQNFNHLRT